MVFTYMKIGGKSDFMHINKIANVRFPNNLTVFKYMIRTKCVIYDRFTYVFCAF